MNKRTLKTLTVLLFLLLTSNFSYAQTLKDIRSSISQISKQLSEVNDALSYFAKKNNKNQRKLIANRINSEAKILSDKSNRAFNLINRFMNSKNSNLIDRKKIEIMKSNAHFISVKARVIEREALKSKKKPTSTGFYRMQKAYNNMANNYDKLQKAYNDIVLKKRN